MNTHRFSVIAGIDLSMTNTGLAIHDRVLGTDRLERIQSKPVQNGTDAKGKRTATWGDRMGRMTGIVQQVVSQLEPGALVFLEAPSYGSVGSGTFDRSGLWWMLYASLDSALGATIVPVSPSQRMLYATGKGGGKDAGKDAVIAGVIRAYPELAVTDNNVADAVVLMMMARRAAGIPHPVKLAEANLRALDKLDLTELDRVSSLTA